MAGTTARFSLPLMQGAVRSLPARNPPLVELLHDRFLTFGRSKRCDVVCGAGASLLSKQHAAIGADTNTHGCWEIRVSDMGSTNGTFVYSRGQLKEGGQFHKVPLRSSQRVPKGGHIAMQDGDLLALGQGMNRVLYELQLPLK